MAYAFLDHPGPIAFAHRGGPAHHLENSWPAFEHAVSLGYTHVETDAQATADGVVLAFHDRTLGRVTDRNGRIARMPYRDVATARIGGIEEIPQLEDVLAAFPDVRFNIDVKDGPVIRPLAALIRRMAVWDRVCLCSFSAYRLRVMRQVLGSRVCMALAPVGVATVRLAGGFPVVSSTLAARLAVLGVRCAQIPIMVATRGFVRQAQALGLKVHVWTVNDRTQMNCLLDMGADGIMTDDTVLLRDVLTERGLWNAPALAPAAEPPAIPSGPADKELLPPPGLAGGHPG
ncbi:MAG TPA: glycerophosphodiester phosphodiesterase family protein [Streptosporangiaceae bacterium]|nr:glycerophosphodiester phosphodiesterase family protein [Streptosporangiaceae bacterium]